MSRRQAVVMGGGTGTSVVLSGLKKHDLDLTAIITVADSGGSTGRLRDEFGFLPVGDLRQSLAALAPDDEQSWIRRLLLYRFSQGEGLGGHNLGNLILTALQDMVGSTPEAVQIAGQIFRLSGSIYPVTSENVELLIEYDDGTVVVGEHHLDSPSLGGRRVRKIHLSQRASLYPPARKRILEADLVVIGPGDLYGSILPNYVVSGAREAFRDTSAAVVYVVNLMTRHGQTHEMSASAHVEELRRYMGRYPDYVIVNTGPIAPGVLEAYEKENEHPVANDVNPGPFQVIACNLVSLAQVRPQPGDAIRRSVLRHDETALADALLTVLDERREGAAGALTAES
jgi:uncharacterized cofD-like protein